MPIPKTIHRFKILREQGKGAQGVVYLALDPQLQRKVAIKTLPSLLPGNGDRQKRLIQEARIVGKLQHPNIIPLYEAGDFNNTPYLVFEFVTGISLRDHLKKEGRLSVRRAVALMKPLLDGIAYAHEQGVIHRDLSPSNILIEAKSGIPRIMDFGISVLSGRKAARPLKRDVAGTPSYMSPEHLSDAPLVPQSDIFSLGLIFYEMVMGRPAIQADNDFTAMYKIAHESIIEPAPGKPDIDRGLEVILLKALERDPSSRWGTALEMKRALGGYMNSKKASSGNGGQERDSNQNATVDFLLRRMRHKSDFPTFSRCIMDINRMASSGSLNYTSASQLSNAIIKDYALTNKLLRLVNSAYYGHFSGRISTVSRAVVILGFEQVKTAAAGLLLFEHLQNASQCEELKDAAISSFMSGMIAENLAADMGHTCREQAFICAMLYKLGRHLVIFYFPEEYEQIKTRVNRKGIDETAACAAILGVSYEELGTGIARAWNFPKKITESMAALPEGTLPAATSEESTLRNLAGFSNSLCAIAGMENGEKKKKALSTLLSRFEKAIPLSTKYIDSLMEKATDRVENYSETLKIDTSKSRFFRNLSNFTAEGELAQETGKGGAHTGEVLEMPDPSSPEIEGLEIQDAPQLVEEVKDPLQVLINGIQEITNTLLDDYELNDVLNMILEIMYRGFSFRRVILCLADPRTSEMKGRFGFGENIEKILEDFIFRVRKANDVFNLSLIHGKDLEIEDSSEPRILGGIPEWYRSLVSAPAFVIYPILVNKRPLGLIYADSNKRGHVLQPERLQYMKTLCNQAILAIRQMMLRA